MTRTATIARGGQGGKALALRLPEGDLGTDVTALAMRAVAEHAAENSRGVAELTKMLSADFLPRSLYAWLRGHVKFKRDGRGLEHIRHPDQQLAAVAGTGMTKEDCDCLATLACAVLLRSGVSSLRPAIIVVSRSTLPDSFEHVFYGTYDAGADSHLPWKLPDNTTPPQLVPYDPQEKTPAGRMPEGVRRFRIYPI
jgi:hypothetical protein